MTGAIELAMIYLAVGAVLFAQPGPGALPADSSLARQGEIFRATLPLVLGWPVVLLRGLR